MVTVAHWHKQLQRSHQCVAGLLEDNRISNGGGQDDGKENVFTKTSAPTLKPCRGQLCCSTKMGRIDRQQILTAGTNQARKQEPGPDVCQRTRMPEANETARADGLVK
ncbi:hypothetical protein EVAR_81718_1 [Eumeta japonica]|uniref:Uncharacterized protein n=1 Tax=Eumeta variegata TaxID=151549 RepID=A0A4C1UHP5_EUMVA|nr:hypothetical protein EVAR_81718_1 [Eumeta japonica]